LSDHNLFDEGTFGDEPCSLDLELYGSSSLGSEVSDLPGLGHKYLQVPGKYSQTCLMWPSKGTVKYGHIRQVVI
jgi:hypothetical protein